MSQKVRQAKYISSLDSQTKKRIKEGVEGLTKNPLKGDIKPMKGYSDGRYRLRVGQYRIIYKYITNLTVLYVIDAGARGGIYKGGD